MMTTARANLRGVEEDDSSDINIEDFISLEEALLEDEDELILDLTQDEESTGLIMLPKILKNDFEGVDKNYARFVDKQLSFVTVTKSTFRYADFEMVNMVGCCVSSADFHGAKMRFVDCEFSEMHKADFSAADLLGANFQGSVMHACDFNWANLKGANFTDCQISECKFEGAVYDEETVLPFSKKRANDLGMILSLTITKHAS